MQFVKNGPDIPERLLQAHEDGKVVLFCGAGVSYRAGLPDFDGLVRRLYIGLGEAPSDVEDTAIRKGQYDTAIGLLERRIAGGRIIVREQLAIILTPNFSAPHVMAMHEALLTLARNREGRYRLITTNFDRLFEEVIARHSLPRHTYHAPLLPVPKSRWDGLVYLHGLLPAIPTGDDLNHLVVSSGDFGLAYLTERWAARFVSELFRNYIVCFVGYSINDPVLRYMMDALAADQLLGEKPCEVFAFGSYSKGREEESANEWRAKNVTPILYSKYRNHIYLHRTLQEWANTYRNGVLGKELIVVQYALTKPLTSTNEDDFVGRMLWALSDHSALPAKRFAEFDPLPVLDWLEPLSEKRFHHGDLARFGVQPNLNEDDTLAFGLVLRPTPYTHAPSMTLVRHSPTEESQWDQVMFQLARWLARHLDDPKLILWVAKQGGSLHAQFLWLIERRLTESPPSAPMRALWRLVLSGCLQSHALQFELYDWCRQLRQEGLTPMLRLQLRDFLSPRVRLREPYHGLEDDDQDKKTTPSRIKDLVDWEIALNAEHVHSALKDMADDARWREALPDFLSDTTILLRDTLDLMRELGGADDRQDMSYIHQPSISKHEQNRGFHDWTVLIDLAREAWIETAAKRPEQARIEAQRWISIPYPLFRRLAFFAASHSTIIAVQQALNWLLADDYWWLWSIETQRETIRLLVTIVPQLEAPEREFLEKAILLGPPRTMFRDDIEPDRLQQIFDREIWLRLAKYSAAGVRLGSDAAAKLQTLSEQYPAWRLASDERDEFPMWMGDDQDWRTFLATPKQCRDLVSWLHEHPKSDIWQEDDWRERCKRDFRRTATALMYMAHRSEWVVDRWREALQAWSDETLAVRSWRCVGGMLATAPDDVAKELMHTLSWWLQSIAKTFSGNEETFFLLIRKILELHRNEATQPDDDPIFKAINHPVGHVTEAALRWWYRRSLEDGQGLPDALRPLFTDLCDTKVDSFRHGRVLLAMHVIALFRVDRKWATKYLLPLFEWQRSAIEARAAWESFLRSPRLYRPLMEAIKPHFLDTAQHYMDLGTYGEQYAALLTFAALERGDMFSKPELVAATRSLPTDGRNAAAEVLVRALEGAGEQHAEYWRNHIQPYLKSIWPKSRDVITPAISKSFAKLCIAAQDAFPEALRELNRWLQPLDHSDFVVQLLHKANLCNRFPQEALAFLNVIVDDTVQWPPNDLKECLDAIRAAQPAIEADNRLQKLDEYLRKHSKK